MIVPPFTRVKEPRGPIVVQGGSGVTSTDGMFYTMGPLGLATLGWGTYNILTYPWSGTLEWIGGPPKFRQPNGTLYDGSTTWLSESKDAPTKIHRTISWGYVDVIYTQSGNQLLCDLEIGNMTADEMLSFPIALIWQCSFSGDITVWQHDPGWIGNGGDGMPPNIPIINGRGDSPPVMGIDTPDCVINLCGDDGTENQSCNSGGSTSPTIYPYIREFNIASGEIRRTRYSIRFYAPGSERMLIEPAVENAFAACRPFLLDWPDHRLVGMIFLAGASAPASNPNKWRMNGGNVDTSTPGGMTAFQGQFLAYADQCISAIKTYDGQGMITWDIEGQKTGPTFYGAPELHGSINGGDTTSMVTYGGVSMTLADAYFKKFRDAGLRVGCTLRPQICASDGSSQTEAATMAAAMADLQASINYAISHWGCTLFYIDSSTSAEVNKMGTNFLPGDFYRSLQTQFPNVLFAPENQTMGAWGAAAPFDSYAHHQVTKTPDKVRRVWPECFQVNLASNGIAPADEAAVMDGMSKGDIYLFDGSGTNDVNQALYDLYLRATTPPDLTVYDPDAADFFNRAQIFDMGQKAAVNQLVLDCKAAGAWSKMKALYPFVGGTATKHKHNLKSSSYQVEFNSNFAADQGTHDANGWTGGFGSRSSTGIIPSTHTTPNSLAFGIYSRTNLGSSVGDIFAWDGNFTGLYLYAGGNFTWYNAATAHSVSVADTLGFFVVSRTSSSQLKAFKNGAQVGATATEVQGALPSINLFLSTCDGPGQQPRQHALSFISDGLTDAEVVALNAAVQTFQTTLERNV